MGKRCTFFGMTFLESVGSRLRANHRRRQESILSEASQSTAQFPRFSTIAANVRAR